MRKRLMTTVGVLAVMACFPLGALRAADACLVKDGTPRARIILPRVFGKATLLAAQELQTYIEKITGARIRLSLGRVQEDKNYPDVTWIVLEPRIDPLREASADGSEDVFTITADRNTLRIAGNSDTAVLYGAYQYLSDLGVRWFMPGPLGENVPHLGTLELKPFKKTYKPSFRTREIDYSGENPSLFKPEEMERLHEEYDLWLVRNKCLFRRGIHNASFHQYDFNWWRENTAHSLPGILHGVDIGKEPERFPLVTRDGETKRLQKAAQICFTHPANIKTTIKDALQWFAGNPDKLTYSTSLGDYGGICECERCVKANEGKFPPQDSNLLVWKFMNQVIRGIREKMPEKRIAFYSCYGTLTAPPAGFKAEPGIVGITANTGANSTEIDNPDNPYARVYYAGILAHKAAGAELGAREYTMFAGTPQPLAILHQFKVYDNLGYVYYHCESMGRDQQRQIIHWVQAQLMWDASQDPAALLKTFCDEYYGAAGVEVLAVLKAIDQQCRSMKRIMLGSLGVTQNLMTAGVIAEGRRLLDRAQGKVRGREAERLTQFRDTFEMLSWRAEIARAAYAAMDLRTERAKKTALQTLNDFEAFWIKRDLAETCSPNILGQTLALRKAIEGINGAIQPQPAKHLQDADKATILKDVFALVAVPEKIENLFLLPEIWKFKPDLDRSGIEKSWPRPDFDDSEWNRLSTYNFYEKQGFDGYDGAYCYRVTFTAPVFPQGKRIILRIGSLDDEGDIYVNGRLAHERRHLEPLNWKTSFAVDVTDHLKPGLPNTIAVLGNDEYGMGGLWRPCALYTQ